MGGPSLYRRPLLILLGAVVLVLLSEPLWAAESWTESLRFRRLSADDGLSQSTVNSVIQDKQGLIWVATQNGLNRFDGSEITIFLPTPQAVGGLSDNYVTSLALDNAGQLWVATLNGLNRYRPEDETFQSYFHDPSDPHSLPASVIYEVENDRSGDGLWIATERGLARWDAEKKQFERIADRSTGLPDDRVNEILQDSRQQIWLGTARGLVLAERDRWQWRLPEDPVSGATVDTLAEDSYGAIWVGYDSAGLAIYEPDAGRWQLLLSQPDASQSVSEAATARPSSNSLRSLLAEADGVMWAGGDAGLDRFERGADGQLSVQRFRHRRLNPHSIGGGGIGALFLGGDGVLWVGSWNGGLSWLSPEQNLFQPFTADLELIQGMSNPSAIALIERNDQLYIGSGEGIYRLGLHSRELKQVSGDHVYFCVQQVGDELWFGATRGLVIVDAQGKARPVALPPELVGARVRRIWVEGDEVWLAADPIGLAKLSRDLKQVLAVVPISRSLTFIRPLGEQLLVGSYAGLHWIDRASGTELYTHAIGDGKGELSTAPMGFIRDTQGTYWLGLNGTGLVRLQWTAELPPSSAVFEQDDVPQLEDGFIKSIQMDSSGTLWVSSAGSISFFDPSTGRLRSFYRNHGTFSRDYINAAATTLSDGRVVFGAMEGFTLFSPERIAKVAVASPPESPLIRRVEYGGQLRSEIRPFTRPGKPLVLPPGEGRSLEVVFTLPYFGPPQSLRFEYKLSGLRDDWIEAERISRTARFDRVPPGNYDFQVRARLADSAWSPPTRIPITVQAYWWQAPWVRLAAFLALILILVMAHRLRLRSVAHRGERLGREVAQRTAQLEERTQALEQSKVAAEKALVQLESAQMELVRAEKLAALGQLVAGVAHEVNTPLGVAVTASSVLQGATRKVKQNLQGNELRRSELENYFSTVAESGDMIERNLERAAHLIANFKQVSVDRTSDGRRKFYLDRVLREILESLELMWRRRSIRTDVVVAEKVQLDSFPGALGQIITNLLQNAVLHGFDGRDSGRIQIHARDLGDSAEILISDDGSGIPEESRKKVFDPFFTTKRNEGGTGLGLHIVHNLITQKLGGTIKLECPSGGGTAFRITLPKSAPSSFS